MKIYLACSFAYKDPKIKAERIKIIDEAAKILRDRGFEVYVPHEHKIPNAWELDNYKWAMQVAEADFKAIDGSDWVVLLTYGKEKNNAGVSCECGYAYAKRIPVLLVKMTDEVESMMMWYCATGELSDLGQLNNFGFNCRTGHLINIELS